MSSPLAYKMADLAYKAANAMSMATVGFSLTDLRVANILRTRYSRSEAGITISAENSMSLDSVFACVRQIAETGVNFPLGIFSGSGDSERSTPQPKHPLWSIFMVSPSPDMSPAEFKSLMFACLVLNGNFYARIVRRNQSDPSSPVLALLPLYPLGVRKIRDVTTGLWVFDVQGQPGVILGGRYTSADIWHVPGFGSENGSEGFSVLHHARNSLGISLSSESVAGSMFRNGLHTNAYIKSPNFVKKGQEDRASQILEEYRGAINSGKVPLLEGGWTIEQTGVSPADLQLLETRGFNIETICRWFGVPPPMIGHMDKSSAWGTGLEQMNRWFYQNTMQPLCTRITESICKYLMAPGDRLTLEAKFDHSALLQPNAQEQATIDQAYVVNGIKTRNEIRAKYGLKALPGGDVLTVQSQNIPLTDVGKAQKAATQAPQVADPTQNLSGGQHALH